MNSPHHQRGFITIAAVLLLLTVSVAVALESLMTAWQSTDTHAAWERSSRARALADACAEHARARLWEDAGYLGSESVAFGMDACSVMPIASGSYEVHTEGRARDVTARLLVVFELSVDGSGSVETLDVLARERVAQF